MQNNSITNALTGATCAESASTSCPLTDNFIDKELSLDCSKILHLNERQEHTAAYAPTYEEAFLNPFKTFEWRTRSSLRINALVYPSIYPSIESERFTQSLGVRLCKNSKKQGIVDIRTGFNDYNVKVEFVKEDDNNHSVYKFTVNDESIELPINSCILSELAFFVSKRTNVVERFVSFDPIAVIETFISQLSYNCMIDGHVTAAALHSHMRWSYNSNFLPASPNGRNPVQYRNFVKRIGEPKFNETCTTLLSCVQQMLFIETQRLLNRHGSGDFRQSVMTQALDGTPYQILVACDGMHLPVHASIHEDYDVRSGGSYQAEGKSLSNRRANSSGRNFGLKSNISASVLDGSVPVFAIGKGSAIEAKQIHPEALRRIQNEFICIFDRAYHSTPFIARCVRDDIAFVIRVKDSCSYKVNMITDADGNEIPLPVTTVSQNNKRLSRAAQKGFKLPSIKVNDPKIRALVKKHKFLNLYVDATTYLPVADIPSEDLYLFDEEKKKGAKNRFCRVENLRVCIEYREPTKAQEANDEEPAPLLVITNLKEEHFSAEGVCGLYPYRWMIELCVKQIRQGDGYKKFNSRNLWTVVGCISLSMVAFCLKNYLTVRAQIGMKRENDETKAGIDECNLGHMYAYMQGAKSGFARTSREVVNALAYLKNLRHQRHEKEDCRDECNSRVLLDLLKIEPGYDNSKLASINFGNDDSEVKQLLLSSNDEALKLLDMPNNMMEHLVYSCLVFGEKAEGIKYFKKLDAYFKKAGLLTCITNNILNLHEECINQGHDPLLVFKAPKQVVSISPLKVHRNRRLNLAISEAIDYIGNSQYLFYKKPDFERVQIEPSEFCPSASKIITEECAQGDITIRNYENNSDYRVKAVNTFAVQHPDKIYAYIRKAKSALLTSLNSLTYDVNIWLKESIMIT